MSFRQPGAGSKVRLLQDGAVVVEAGVAAPDPCDACGAPIEGEAGGRGLLVWARGDELRREEPPLCERCACAIGLAALAHWEHEEDGGE